MAAPQVIEEKALSQTDVKTILETIEARDQGLNYISNKCKKFLDNFTPLSAEKKQELQQKLTDLNQVRLKEEHIMKIIDFLPASVEELKIVLQAYPLSLPKGDQEAIVKVVKEFK